MPVQKGLLLLLTSASIGDGEIDLGNKLMQSFLSVLLKKSELLKKAAIPERIICMNSAVFLTTEGSAVLEQMKGLAEAGAEILSCGTCLEYYGRTTALRVGKPGTMNDTVASMLSFDRVISP